MSPLRRLIGVFFRLPPERALPPAASMPAPGAATAEGPGAPTGDPIDSRTRGPGDARLRTRYTAAVAEPFLALFQIREPVHRGTAALLGAIPIAAVVLLWWLVTWGATPEERRISPVILPSPGEVIASFPALWQARDLPHHVAVSLSRVLGGYLCAAAVAVPLGIAMGAFTKIKAIFNPLAVMGSYLPFAALVPLTFVWFGFGEFQKVMFLALVSFVCLLPLVVKAIDDVDAVYVNTAYTLGANRWQTMTKVLVTVALPDIFNALRLTFAIGWTYIILVEIVDIGAGLGGLIMISQRRGPREHIYLVLATIMLLAFAIDQVFQWAARALFPYRTER